MANSHDSRVAGDFDLTQEPEGSPGPSFPEIADSPAPDSSTAAIPAESASPFRFVRALFAAIVGLILPGFGHLVLGKWRRAVILAVSVAAMFAIGAFWMEGRLYQPSMSDPVSIFPFLANAGLGGIYLGCYLTHTAFAVHAEAATYEYGNTFLFVAGLLNYLILLDAYDIGVGKRA